MPRRSLPRTLALCAILALPAALSACVNEATPPPAAAPIDYGAYSKLPLNVASLSIEQRYFASGQPPDVSADDPINPVSALREMAQERLQTAGASGHAVFAIDNASVIDQDGELIGAATVTLSIIDARGARVGYAQTTVTRQLVGFGSDLHGALYSLTTALMQQMNVEFENQVRRSLGPWLLAPNAVPAPVQQAPFQPGAPPGVVAVPPAPTPYPSPYPPTPYPPAYPQTPSYQPGAPIPLTPPPYTPPPAPPSATPPAVITPPGEPAPTPMPQGQPVAPPISAPPPITQPSPPPVPPPAPAPTPAPTAPGAPSGLPPLGPVVE